MLSLPTDIHDVSYAPPWQCSIRTKRVVGHVQFHHAVTLYLKVIFQLPESHDFGSLYFQNSLVLSDQKHYNVFVA